MLVLVGYCVVSVRIVPVICLTARTGMGERRKNFVYLMLLVSYILCIRASPSLSFPSSSQGATDNICD